MSDARVAPARKPAICVTSKRLYEEAERGRGSATLGRDASDAHSSLQLHAQHHGEAPLLRAALVPGFPVG